MKLRGFICSDHGDLFSLATVNKAATFSVPFGSVRIASVTFGNVREADTTRGRKQNGGARAGLKNEEVAKSVGFIR